MAITLQAYAENDGNNMNVTLKTIKDLSEITEKSFLLPKEKGAFIALTDEIYNASETPTYITKKEFKEGFIDYTLNQNYELISADELTTKYNELFSLTMDEAIGFVQGLDGNQNLEAMVNAQKAEMENLLKLIKDGSELSLNKYITEQNLNTTDETLEATPFGDTDDSEDALDPSSPDFGPSSVGDPYEWGEDVAAQEPPPTMPLNTDTQNIAAQANFNPNSAANLTSVAPLPKTKNKRPVVDQANLDNQSITLLNGMPVEISNNMKGIAGDRLIEPVPEPLIYPGDAHVKGENNTLIQCGRDEVYRLKGHTQAGAIYVVAGRSPNDIKTEDKDSTTLNPADSIGLKKPNNLVRDSAYLYLSQKSDPATLLRVAGGTYAKKIGGTSPRAGLSLAAIKADDVVVMSRTSGIRLITGTDRSNSSGGEMVSKFGIELIAGNDDSDLQPLIKGDNLELYLTNLSEVVSNLRSVVYSFITTQLELNAELALHTHWDPFSIFLGSLATGNPLAVNKGENYFSPGVLQSGTKAMLANATQQANAITGVMIKRINNDFNAFNPVGGYNIKSQKNKTN